MTLPGVKRGFSYWDQCADQVDSNEGVYGEETARKINEVMMVDVWYLKELGDTSTTSPTLTNNRNERPGEQVISKEAKVMIDGMLDVSKAVKLLPEESANTCEISLLKNTWTNNGCYNFHQHITILTW